jgi:hypothetical protein
MLSGLDLRRARFANIKVDANVAPFGGFLTFLAVG